MHIPLVLEISKIVMVIYRAAMLLHYAHLAVGCVSENVALLYCAQQPEYTLPCLLKYPESRVTIDLFIFQL